MSTILGISSDGLLSLNLALHPGDSDTQTHPYCWGVGWYPGNESSAVIQKDPLARGEVVFSDDFMDLSRYRSGLYLCRASSNITGHSHDETQPFSLNFAGKEWVFCHGGDLDKTGLENLLEGGSRFLEPVGRSTSELAFCYIIGKIQQTDARSIMEVEANLLRSWLGTLDPLGGANVLLSDGSSLIGYRGSCTREKFYYSRLLPPSTGSALKGASMALQFDDPRDIYRTQFIFSSECLDTEHLWSEMLPGQLIVVRQGLAVWDSHEQVASNYEMSTSPSNSIPPYCPIQTPYQRSLATMSSGTQSPPSSIVNLRSMTHSPDGQKLSYRKYDVTHLTQYSYDSPVLHSTHTLRLQPIDTPMQEVKVASINISAPGEQILYEDVFGNQALHYSINEPYTSLRIESQFTVRIYARPPDDVSLARRQTTIPLVWMPWQRQMMTPYLLPPELPDTQLEELAAYAMSFVERNDYYLLDTLKDMNTSIYRDYAYTQGSTSLQTTAFEVYKTRSGVCQDFANIFICLARLLGIPARYQMGYIHTGTHYENKIQSDASHAWVEVYLPYIGWRGYDPTNGCLVAQDHICVARGRNYVDATPTSGTLFKGGANEKLFTEVKVQELSR